LEGDVDLGNSMYPFEFPTVVVVGVGGRERKKGTAMEKVEACGLSKVDSRWKLDRRRRLKEK